MDIKITVKRKLPICGDVAIVCNNSDYTVIWELDEEWSGYDTKTMRTAYKDGTYTDTVFTGDTVALPVVTVPGTVKIGLYAGDIRTSRPALIRALGSITSDGGTPADPPEDVYNQLMELLKGMGGASEEDIAKAVAKYLTEHPPEEKDPTVPAWAKETEKPTYTADEVGAATMDNVNTVLQSVWDEVVVPALNAKQDKGDYLTADDLQDATNAALAQAKASGEFDGADGAPGKDGAPGPAGAGMNVTGATVGQIAKITVVDDNGKPTAWEPVDMPSGGGETWREIALITIPDDPTTDTSGVKWVLNDDGQVIRFVVTKDANGNDFNLRNVLIRASMSSADANTTKDVEVAFNKADTYTLSDLTIEGLNKNDSAQTEVQINIRKGTNVASILYGVSNNALYGGFAQIVRMMTPNNKLNGRNGLALSSINKFVFWSAIAFKAGSKLKIWGVDA